MILKERTCIKFLKNIIANQMNDSDVYIIDSPRLSLLALDVFMLNDLILGEDIFSIKMDISFEEGWNTFGTEIFEQVLTQLENPKEANWWIYLFLNKKENIIIGTGGYKGAPDGFGMVEIGYEIAKKYQGKGLATEAVKALTDNAFLDYGVCFVQAHTLKNDNASTSVLKNNNFVFQESYTEEKGQTVYRWENLRPELRM